MKNFEKYEKEIKEAIEENELFNVADKLSGKRNIHGGDIINWLYEEPLLTEQERISESSY